jgi:hypothetical protein
LSDLGGGNEGLVPFVSNLVGAVTVNCSHHVQHLLLISMHQRVGDLESIDLPFPVVDCPGGAVAEAMPVYVGSKI